MSSAMSRKNCGTGMNKLYRFFMPVIPGELLTVTVGSTPWKGALKPATVLRALLPPDARIPQVSARM
jgi:hypothetical protein